MSIASPYLVADEFAFEADDDWAKVPEGYEFNEVAGVSVDGDDNVYVFVRGPHPMLKFDKHGAFVKSWGEGFYGGRAHGVHVGPDGFVYVVENTRHAIDKWTRDGELVWTLGTPNQPAPKWSGQAFNLPTHMAVSAKTGDIFVGDGYGNNSVHRFSNDGKLLKTWGGHGIEPGSFQCPHNLCLDDDDYVYVCDRENNRIQVFDGDGRLLDIWSGFAPYGLALDTAGTLFVADGRANQILRLSETGEVVKSWGGKGSAPGQFQMPHMLAFDQSGNLLVAEVNGKRLQRLLKR
jgi:DNA-binding beta-propeller fold protein YncE